MENNNIIIRKAVMGDLDFITQGNIAMARETENKSLSPPIVRQGVRAVLNTPQYGFYIVAEKNHRPIGQVLVTFEWSDWRNGLFWWIQSVYILPEWRGNGIFRQLQEYIIRLARKDSRIRGLRLYVDQGNTRAKKVYSHLGWEPTEYELYELEW